MNQNPRNSIVIAYDNDDPHQVCIIGNHYTEAEAIQKLIEKEYISKEDNMMISEMRRVWVRMIKGDELFESSGEATNGARGYKWRFDKRNGYNRKGTLVELMEKETV